MRGEYNYIDATSVFHLHQTRITVYVGGGSDIQPIGSAVTVTYGDMSASPTTTPTPTPNGDVGNFGTCTTPQIEFGAGFDGRNETSYRPVDKGKQPLPHVDHHIQPGNL